jgi:hypothetical protein
MASVTAWVRLRVPSFACAFLKWLRTVFLALVRSPAMSDQSKPVAIPPALSGSTEKSSRVLIQVSATIFFPAILACGSHFSAARRTGNWRGRGDRTAIC